MLPSLDRLLRKYSEYYLHNDDAYNQENQAIDSSPHFLQSVF